MEDLKIIVPILVSVVSVIWGILNQVRIDRLKHEHQIRFARLHDMRLVIIEKIYKMINIFEKQLNSYKKDDNNFEKLLLLNRELNDYIDENKLYLDSRLVNTLLNFLQLLDRVNTKIAQMERESAPPTEEFEDEIERLFYGSNLIKKEIHPLKLKLEKEFRNLIGVK